MTVRVFGSVDGDSAAAYRYTECRLTKISEELLSDIDEDTVDFIPNYKESSTEPSVLPAALPTLLMNGIHWDCRRDGNQYSSA